MHLNTLLAGQVLGKQVGGPSKGAEDLLVNGEPNHTERSPISEKLKPAFPIQRPQEVKGLCSEWAPVMTAWRPWVFLQV